jgi:hypothetical protein
MFNLPSFSCQLTIVLLQMGMECVLTQQKIVSMQKAASLRMFLKYCSQHVIPFYCLAVCSYVIVVEHDLSVLDYLSDFICCLYGKPGAYGVVTLPFSVREGINIFLAGFVPTENLRFRDESLTFKVCSTPVYLESICN